MGKPIGNLCHEYVSPQKCAQLAAIFDWPAPQEGDPLPPLWHWLFCTAVVPRGAMGHDGHENAERLDPRLAGLHRMWAGGEILFDAPIPIGAELTRQTMLHDIVQKDGRSGPLLFATLAHIWQCEGKVVIRETQTLVYREAPGGSKYSVPDPGGEDARMPWHLDDLQLFRYSALTFNAHRIHLDRTYCAQNYGSSRVVAHAPLQATLVARAAEMGGGRLAHFRFRALNPLREGDGFAIEVDRAMLSGQIRNAQGVVCLDAQFEAG